MEGYHQKKKDFHLKAWEGVETVLMIFLGHYGAISLEHFVKLQASKLSHMLSMVRHLRSMGWETLPLLLLSSLRIMRSTDPRDKALALFGFVGLDGPFLQLITTDYEKDTEKVYLDIARYLILTEQTFDVLKMRHLRLSIGHPPSMPSWVPDWESEGKSWLLYYENSGKDRASNKTKIVSQLVTFLPDGKLSAKGFELDVISEVFNHALLPFRYTLEASIPTFEEFVKCIVTESLVRGETTLSALSQTNEPQSPTPIRSQVLQKRSRLPLIHFHDSWKV